MSKEQTDSYNTMDCEGGCGHLMQFIPSVAGREGMCPKCGYKQILGGTSPPDRTNAGVEKKSEIIFHPRKHSVPSPPQSSEWAMIYRFCGGSILLLGIILTIVVAQKNEASALQLAVMTVAGALSCFLFAFLVDVLTDMRHYQRQSAECLQKLLEK